MSTENQHIVLPAVCQTTVSSSEGKVFITQIDPQDECDMVVIVPKEYLRMFIDSLEAEMRLGRN